MTPFTINSATAKKLSHLLAMIRELAEFERLTYALEGTAASLRAARVGERPVAAPLLARVDGFPAGCVVYDNTFRFHRSLGGKVRDKWALLRRHSREVKNLAAAEVKVTP
jgi:hypothetical protein